MARKISVELLGNSASLERAFARSSRAAGGFNRDISHAGRGIAAVSLGYRSLARSVAFASTAFVGAAGLTAGLKASISGFSQFNEAMQRSVGLAGVAQDSVAGFSKQVQQLATKVGKSPLELANAFYFVASSGIAASKAMGVVTAAAKASAAGLGETQVVADAVTSAMNAYGPSVLSAQKATDVLVATVRQGKGEADQFAGVIGNVTALAAQLGVGFNEVGAALAAMTRLGTDAETSSTQLQRVFTALVKVTPQQAEAFKSVGLNANTLREQLGTKGLLFVLEEIRKSFGNNIPAIEKAFGDIRAFRGVISLVGKQAASTKQIFKDMADTTGSLKTAFSAVSDTAAQQFRKMKASAEVLGISIGAIFAPIAGKVADALAGAATQLSGFFNRLGAARTFDAKINVVVSGLENIAAGLTASIATAVSQINWDEVWSHAQGIADGLQRRLDQINWSSVGSAIGKGIAKGVAGAGVAFKELANRVEKAFNSIDFVALGVKLGPALAGAVVSAFATLTDPSFWLHHWQLALSVALVAFGGSVGRIAGKLAEPLVRVFGDLGERASLAIASGFARISERLGTTVLDALLKLPGLVASILRPLTNVVERVFNRLGRVSRFVVKVLGVDAAINLVGHLVSRVAHLIGHGLDAAWNEMKRHALEAALKIVEPFSHIPGFLGGGPFQRMKAALQNKLAQMDKAASRSANSIASVFDRAAARIASAFRGMASSVIGSIGAAAQAVGAAIGKLKIADVKKAVAAADAAVPKALAPKGAGAQSSSATSSPASATGFSLPFRLQLAQAKASATATIQDDLKVAREIRAFILKAIPHLHGQKLIDAYNQLGQINQEIASDVKAAGKKGQQAIQSFAEPLKLQLAEARAQALGLDDSKILRKMKQAALKAIKSGKLSIQAQIDAWNQIASINQQLSSTAKAALGSFKQASTAHLTANLGLTDAQRKALRARLSQLGPNGTVPGSGVGAAGFIIDPATGRPVGRDQHRVPVTTSQQSMDKLVKLIESGRAFHASFDIYLDGKPIEAVVTRRQQRRRGRNPSSRRGPHAVTA